MSLPVVSILIPTYNCARYLPILCESIQHQTLADFEVLIWNDGSTDDTLDVIAPFRRDKRFQVMGTPDNRGLNSSWRELLKRAKGEFWCSPGADDVLFPDFLNRRIATLRSEPDAALVHGPPLYIDANGKELKGVFPDFHPAEVQVDALLALLEHNFINQPAVVAQMAATRKVLPSWSSEWRYAPDWHLWILLAATGQKFLYDVLPAHRYRIHSNSISGDPDSEAIRLAEVRLVPLCALAQAQGFSTLAAQCWKRWRVSLYALWLWRALKISQTRMFCPGWVASAASAFYGRVGLKVSLSREVRRHFLSIVTVGLRERRAKRRNRVAVAGLAQICHPLFR